MAKTRKGPGIKLSVIMVDGGFRERFHGVDFFCRQSFHRDDYELIWVEFYGEVRPELEDSIAGCPQARILTLNRQGVYHSSYCFNAGIQASRGEVLFLPDADVVVEEDFLDRAYRDHEENPRLVMYFFRMDEAREDHREDISLEHLKRVGRLRNPQNYGGCLSIRKSWLLTVNGYDQHPALSTGFHANGLDMYTRLKNLGLHVRWHPDLRLYHPWHPFSVSPSPLYRIQKVFIDHKARALQTATFSGIDPSRNIEAPPELDRLLEAAKRENRLEGIYEAWGRLDLDPGTSSGEPWVWQDYAGPKKEGE